MRTLILGLLLLAAPAWGQSATMSLRWHNSMTMLAYYLNAGGACGRFTREQVTFGETKARREMAWMRQDLQDSLMDAYEKGRFAATVFPSAKYPCNSIKPEGIRATQMFLDNQVPMFR